MHRNLTTRNLAHRLQGGLQNSTNFGNNCATYRHTRRDQLEKWQE